MGLLGWITRQIRGRQKPLNPRAAQRAARRSGGIDGIYDAAQDDVTNTDHFANADALNANAANSPGIRKTLRERGRYETFNNPNLDGTIDKVGNDLIGTCPHLQLTLPEEWEEVDREFRRRIRRQVPKGAARIVERKFAQWARRVVLGGKLRLLDNASRREGEGFGMLITNPALPESMPQLDIRLYETDQVDTPFLDWTDPLAFPGGRLDEVGNVVEWHLLKAHPGSNVWVANYLEYEKVPDERMLHWSKPRRAGELRPVPEIHSTLPNQANLRRFTRATVAAAETAANYAMVLKTTLPPAEGSAVEVKAMSEVPITYGTGTALPAGWEMQQTKAEHPNTEFAPFRADLQTESGHVIGAPRNIATNSSSEYNYSSARLDLFGIFRTGQKCRRADIVLPNLDKLFRAWYAEARLIDGYLPKGLPPIEQWTWDWRFDGFPSIDPQKDASANEINLRTGTTTLAEIYAERGLDWEEQLEQRGRELARMREIGLMPAAAPAEVPAAIADDNADEDPGNEQASEAEAAAA